MVQPLGGPSVQWGVMPVEPPEVASVSAGDPVLSDRPCRKCGYNIRGLREGQRCPECGTPIGGKRRTSRFADNLTDSPMWYLVVVLSGSVFMALSLVGSFVFSAFERARSANWNPLPVWVVAVGAGVLGLLWLGGVVLTTSRRPHGEHTVRDPILDSEKMRWGARLAQVVFLAGVLTRYLATSTGNAAAEFAAGVLVYVSLIAVAPLSVYLGSLLDWAGDTGGGDRMRNSAWAFVVGGGGALVFDLLLRAPIGFKMIVAVLLVLCSLAVLIGVVLFVLSVLGLAYTSGWALQNAGARRAREARMAERKRRQLEKDIAVDAERERKAAMGSAGLRAPAPEPEALPLEVPADDRDEVDRALGELSPSVVPQRRGPALPGAETGVDLRRRGPTEHRVDPPATRTEGYELEPEG